ncbi:MAG: zinc ABC transporter substrate-binding protein [Acholeplasma sp.]|nr:zinc ABC transporter substrate-binding protein [Acholeplasma sp.]
MKKLFIVLPVLLMTLLLSACQTKTYDIVVTMFPQYEMVKQIVGDKDLSYTMLLSPGVEIHDFEPTSKQIGMIQSSKLFIYTSDELETWGSNMTNNGVVANLEDHIETIHNHEGESEEIHDEEDTHDVHYWVSVHNQIDMVEAILALIVEIDPDNQTYYITNAETFMSNLNAIDSEFETLTLEPVKPIYFIGHNVFSSLNEEFGLSIISLTDSYSPESDPTSVEIGQMIDDILTSQSTHVYYDPFENDAVAKTIQSDLKSAHNYDIILVPLHSMHNLSKAQFDDGIDLLDLWTENLANIKLTYESGS